MSSELAPGRHFFLVRSSLQFILATALAEQARRTSASTCWLAFLPDVLDPQLFERACAGWSDSPFERIVFIAPRAQPGQAGKARTWGALRRDILDTMERAQPTAVTVFNDRQDPGQTVLIEAARRFPGALRACAEDGALAYTGFTYRRYSVFTRWRQRLRLGRGWNEVLVLGTHPLVQQFVAIHPQLLRPELRDRSVAPFPASQLGAQPLQRLAARFCELVGLEAQSIPAGAVLLTLSHSSYARRNPDYLQLVDTCIAQLRLRSTPFFFKYHPREAEADYLGIGAQGTPGSAREIPRTIPVECIYLLTRELPLLVVAGMSTSLLTGALLMPRARIAALVHESAAGDAWDAGLLEALAIRPLAETGAMAAYIDAWRDTSSR